MPNQRKKTKRHVGAWLNPQEIEAVKKTARDKGMTVKELLLWASESYEQKRKVGKIQGGEQQGDSVAGC